MIEFTDDGKRISARSWAALRKSQPLSIKAISDILGISFSVLTGMRSDPPQWAAVIMLLLQRADADTIDELIFLRKISERWRTIKRFPQYEASSMGRIRRVGAAKGRLPGEVLKPKKRRTGHLGVTIYSDDGKMHTVSVHRLIAETFLRKRVGRNVVCHINGRPAENMMENLYWGTYKTNGADRTRHKLERAISAKKEPKAIRKPNNVDTVGAHTFRYRPKKRVLVPSIPKKLHYVSRRASP